MINLAVVGMGRWGQVLVDAVQGKSDKVRFTAGVTRTPSKVADYAGAKGLAMKDRLEDLLADPSIGGIVLATPHSQHADQMVACAAAGKPVFVEKPVTLTRADGERSFAAAERAGIVVAAGFNRRFHPAVIDMKAIIASGKLGRLLHIETNISSSAMGQYKPGMWRADRSESPAGGMGAMGIHMVDVCVNLMGPIEGVHAQAVHRALDVDIDDATSVLFRFASGATGYLATMWATTRGSRVAVFGEHGVVEWRNKPELEFRPVQGEPETRTYPVVDLERAELEAFADAVAGRKPYPIPRDEVLNGIAAFEAVTLSSADGQWKAI